MLYCKSKIEHKDALLLLKVIGILFVSLAALGAVLPLLPTTPFLLVAAACFAKSSPRLYNMLLANKVFGPLIYHWQQSKSIPKRGKVVALVSIVFAASWSVYVMDNIWLKILVVALIAGPFIFICKLPIAEGNHPLK